MSHIKELSQISNSLPFLSFMIMKYCFSSVQNILYCAYLFYTNTPMVFDIVSVYSFFCTTYSSYQFIMMPGLFNTSCRVFDASCDLIKGIKDNKNNDKCSSFIEDNKENKEHNSFKEIILNTENIVMDSFAYIKLYEYIKLFPLIVFSSISPSAIFPAISLFGGLGFVYGACLKTKQTVNYFKNIYLEYNKYSKNKKTDKDADSILDGLNDIDNIIIDSDNIENEVLGEDYIDAIDSSVL